jgi:DNA replication protein DnaC
MLQMPTSRSTCFRCEAPLPADRFAQCEACDAEVARAIEAQEDRKAALACEARLKASGLPSAFATGERGLIDLGRVAGSALPMKAVTILDGGSGLYLWGPAGSYKTTLACGILAGKIRGGDEGFYCYLPDLFTELAAIYASQNQESRRDVIERYAGAQWLLFDDIDKAKMSAHSAEILGAIIDFRYREGKRRNIFTANMPIDELARRFERQTGETYAEPLLRRIAEMTTAIRMEKR